jgi:hypothetical protein
MENSETPVRMQRKRSKGWRIKDASPNGLDVICVSRESRWGNPYPVERHGREGAVQLYEASLQAMPPAELDAFLAPLRGKNVCCWCKEGRCFTCVGPLRGLVQTHTDS